ncbi:hypothetical protein G9A89_012948 [Geosiphon pyriformis]|nr:hypothetical protein G9A89_012948 [Geosiphon pyriformis]
MPDLWFCQYMPLNYVDNDAFFSVIKVINITELFLIVDGLPNGKVADMFEIPNELWKHCGKKMLACLLELLNSCLSLGTSYKWNGILTNTKPIALVNTAHKILSKILSDQISSACSKFDVLCEKNRELWLVLQDMHKAYNSVGWYYLRMSLYHIKMCKQFIQFFGGIHKNRVNRVITDFGLIIKRHKHLCKYRIDTRFVVKFGRVELTKGKTFFLAAGVFIDDTIWYILNIASKFFMVNNISINNDKIVAIPINQGVKNAFLLINKLPILIVKKSMSYQYLDIFLLTEGFSVLSLVQAHKDVRFFSNVVLRKAITDKQFCYLVSAVLQPIISYYTQFSFISLGMCRKWNMIIRKSLRSKTGLPCDFSSKVLHHLFLYGLKPFKQMQSEEKLAFLILFSNSCGILRCFPMNNFLVEVVKILLVNELLLTNNLSCAFCEPGVFPMSGILGQSLYYKSVFSLRWFSIVFGNRLLDKKEKVMNWKTFWQGLVPCWFILASDFMYNPVPLEVGTAAVLREDMMDVLISEKFFFVHNSLLEVWFDCIEIYMDESLKGASFVEVADGAAVYFPAADMSIGVRVARLLSSTLTELQAVALALECVPSFCSVVLYLDSQLAIDACVSEVFLFVPDFYNQCWIERLQIWVKVKSHSNVSSNVKTNALAGIATFSFFSLPVRIQERFLVAKKNAVSGNARHFVHDLYQSICHVYWEAGSGFNIVPSTIIEKIDWGHTVMV